MRRFPLLRQRTVSGPYFKSDSIFRAIHNRGLTIHSDIHRDLGSDEDKFLCNVSVKELTRETSEASVGTVNRDDLSQTFLETCRSLSIDLYGATTPEKLRNLIDQLPDKTQKDTIRSLALLFSCQVGLVELLQYLLLIGVSVNTKDKHGRSALHYAASFGCEDCIDLLIKSGADINCWDSEKKTTPLICSVYSQNSPCLVKLIRHGADVNAGMDIGGATALIHAVRLNALITMRILLKSGASIDGTQVYTETPVHAAAREGYTECLRLLIKKGANVSIVQGPSKMTALHLAAEDGATECVQLLLASKASPNVKNAKGQTPLHLASLNQSVETIDSLIKAGCDLDELDNENRTALHNCIVKGSRTYDCLRVLLEAGADPNKQDMNGYTPLHMAALYEYTNCVELLLEFGADLTMKTNGNITCLNFITRKTPEALGVMESLLDSSLSFVEDNTSKRNEIQLDFRVLMPGRHHKETNLLMTFIEENQRELLKHPLCESFLYLKWQKVRKYYVFNIVFYSIFVGFLTVYILQIFSNECFVEATVNTTDCRRFDTFVKREAFLESLYITVIRRTLFGLILVLGLKEIFQIMQSLKEYWRSMENWLQWTIFLTTLVLSRISHENGFIRPWQDHVAAVAIALAWLELMLLIGRFPFLGLYVQMFTIVAKDFGKFLLAYSSLLVAFSLSFDVLFNGHCSFIKAFESLIKTFVMMTGEFEFEDMFYNQDTGRSKMLYPGTVHIIFSIFLLLIAIVLMNLLVGLAVNDINALQETAGMERLVRLTKLIAHIESTIFCKGFNLLPANILNVFQRGAILIPSSYRWTFYVRPNDPRDKRIPKEIQEAVLRCVLNKKGQTAGLRRTLMQSFSTSGVTDSDDLIVNKLILLEWRLQDMENLIKSLNR